MSTTPTKRKRKLYEEVTEPDNKVAKHKQDPKPEVIYDVEEITDSRVAKFNGGWRAEFWVKWKGFRRGCWEPMNQLFQNCAFLFEDYEKRSGRKIRRAAEKSKGGELEERVPNFPPVAKGILKHFNNPQEYVPTGKEEIMDISKSPIKISESESFLFVQFMRRQTISIVRPCLLEYFFPSDCAYFHKKMSAKHTSVT
jgi:hypothetical protein